MTKHMIVSSQNMLSLYIGVIWRAKDVFQNNIWFGVMVVLHNSNVLKHGTLWAYYLLTSCDQRPEDVQMCWNLPSCHGKGEINGACDLLKREICKEHKGLNTTIARCSWRCPILSTMTRYVNYVFTPLQVIVSVFHALCKSFLCACVKHLNVGPFCIIS